LKKTELPARLGLNRLPKNKAEVARVLAEVDSAIERAERGITLQQEADELSQSFTKFVRRAWPIIEPSADYRHNWHIDAICKHLQKISDGLLQRLQIWVPPASGKSALVSILWPAWEWTRDPGMRYYTGSYHQKLSAELTARSRDLVMSDWYQERWGHLFDMRKTSEEFISNSRGGTRLATSPDMKAQGTGRHGHRVIVDDAVNAMNVSPKALSDANEWYSGLVTRKIQTGRGAQRACQVIVMQRLAENDVAAHALTLNSDWTIVCIPEVFEADHEHRYPEDPRVEGELMWPAVFNEEVHQERIIGLGRFKAAGQLQQRPAAREGEILKRAHWNFYDKKVQDDAHMAQSGKPDVRGYPKFTRIVVYWDTSFKEKTTSDFVAGTMWGARGSQRYLLRIWHDRMSLPKTITHMIEAREWARKRWPNVPVTTVVEKKSNGIEILEQYQREVPGMVADNPSTDKTERAIACESDFDARQVYVPGRMNEALDNYSAEHTPPEVQELIDQCAGFPNATHDDLVDSTTGALNWIRKKGSGRARISSPANHQINVGNRRTGNRRVEQGLPSGRMSRLRR
jgi:predicted phage terminase large subunit-like protein